MIGRRTPYPCWVYSLRLLRVATASGCDPYLVGASSGPTQNSPGGEFRVSPRHLLFGVSLPGGGTAGVGVDERIEGASGRPTWFVLLDVDQVDYVAPVHPLVETHLSVASFDAPNQAADEEDGVRTIIPLVVSSVDFHGDWLVHAFSPQREDPARTEVGCPGRTPAVSETLTPRA